MADLVWLHEGALRLTHPVFAAGGPDATTIFIWDRDRLAASHVGIKRQLFIYETLAEMSESRSLDIHEGRAEEVDFEATLFMAQFDPQVHELIRLSLIHI